MDIEWSPAENKKFELILADLDITTPHLFEKLAVKIPNKTIDQLRSHYMKLFTDIEHIDRSSVTTEIGDSPLVETKEMSSPTVKKPMQWSEEEHKLFLMGLNVHGRGNWKSISKNFVRTRSPSQVASHAQKFFHRHSSAFRKRHRNSVLDITTVGTITKSRRVSIYDLCDTTTTPSSGGIEAIAANPLINVHLELNCVLDQ